MAPNIRDVNTGADVVVASRGLDACLGRLGLRERQLLLGVRGVGLETARPPGERLAGSIAATLFAVEHGARLVRAHDVRDTLAALRVQAALRGAVTPGAS